MPPSRSVAIQRDISCSRMKVRARTLPSAWSAQLMPEVPLHGGMVGMTQPGNGHVPTVAFWSGDSRG